MFIDTHSHLFLGELSAHIDDAIRHLEEEGFSHSIQIGTNIDTSITCIELAKKYHILRAAIGIHPCEAQDIEIENIPPYMNQLESMIQKDRAYIVGLGEIGFDYYHLSGEESLAKEQKIRQKYWFEAQVELAMKYQLPVVIHTRNCPEITLDALKNSHVQKFVIHCFSEDWGFAEKILSLSPQARISFTGILTYGKSLQVQEVAKKLPLERIMIETDAPYLLPETLKGSVSYCEPVHTKYVYEKLCEIRTEDRDIIEKKIWENSIDFFEISLP